MAGAITGSTARSSIGSATRTRIELVPRRGGLGPGAGKKGGQATGPNPTDQRETVAVNDAPSCGGPERDPAGRVSECGQCSRQSPCQARSSKRFPPIHRPRGRPRRRPTKLHADKGYDTARCHLLLRLRRIIDRYIAPKGQDSRRHLGRYRWVVERTLAWLNRYRRLTIRYERRLDIHQAFVTHACASICWNYVQRML